MLGRESGETEEWGIGLVKQLEYLLTVVSLQHFLTVGFLHLQPELFTGVLRHALIAGWDLLGDVDAYLQPVCLFLEAQLFHVSRVVVGIVISRHRAS